MGNRYHHQFSATFYFICSMLLALALPHTAAAINFTVLDSGQCNETGVPNDGFCQDIGIDYSQWTGNLISSVHFNNSGNPNNLDNIDRINGARTVAAPGFFNHGDELKVATARQV